jgi:hypothetical protein
MLNDQANNLTTEVIAFRKSLPARRAQAMEKRAAVIRALEAKKEEQRRAVEREHAAKLREQSRPIALDLKRKAEVADTLEESVVDITSLQVVSPHVAGGQLRVGAAAITLSELGFSHHVADSLCPRRLLLHHSRFSSKRQPRANRQNSSSACGQCRCRRGRRITSSLAAGSDLSCSDRTSHILAHLYTLISRNPWCFQACASRPFAFSQLKSQRADLNH